MTIFFQKHRFKILLAIIAALIYLCCLPSPLFDTPTCMVLEDRNGELLGARIAADGQWRFPQPEEVPDKFVQAITTFEDKRFFSHWGIDPFGLARAMKQNIANRRIVSGGSTLTMQVIRLARSSPPRTVWQKLIEMVMATRLELKYSKQEILALYAGHAPFGGNVVGLEAASWRYYGKSSHLLSWAEAATLAVLPNSPALIHPGRNRQQLLAKRDRLLDRMHRRGILDDISLELAKEEGLPDQPLALPQLAPHLLDRAYLEHVKSFADRPSRVRTTLNRHLQEQCIRIISRHHRQLKSNGIHNLAALVVDIETGNVLSYIGNVADAGETHAESVDIIPARRSTGSILKPFLYTMMLQEGDLLPSSLIPDIPTQLNGYRPVNYHETYDGMVTARRALVRSLNVPFIRLLQQYGLEKFHFGLHQLGLHTIDRPPSHYGLPLVLGGAESTLWDITQAYSSMARTLVHFYEFDGKYSAHDFRPLNYQHDLQVGPSLRKDLLKEAPVLQASAIWLCFEAMRQVERPNALGNWERFQSGQRIAWKTGTSFGFRDAWAVGLTPKYIVGVWAGNADGEGRPGLIGVQAAAPVLFDIFAQLKPAQWFEQPFDEMLRVPVCKDSGYRPLSICERDTIWAPLAAVRLKACNYHKRIHLDESGQWQVNSHCVNPNAMQHRSWFVLPPVEEYYFKSKNPGYRMLPPYRTDCQERVQSENPMQLIYPKYPTKIYVPLDLDGTRSRTVFRVVHRDPETTLFWHLDNEYIGQTSVFHNLELNPQSGQHRLVVVDAQGYRLEQEFEIIEK